MSCTINKAAGVTRWLLPQHHVLIYLGQELSLVWPQIYIKVLQALIYLFNPILSLIWSYPIPTHQPHTSASNKWKVRTNLAPFVTCKASRLSFSVAAHAALQGSITHSEESIIHHFSHSCSHRCPRERVSHPHMFSAHALSWTLS